MTEKIFNGRVNTNTLVMGVCSFIILSALGWVGRTASNTHDSVIRLEENQAAAEKRLETSQAASDKDINAIKAAMLTRADLSIELLKLQVPPGALNKEEKK